MVWEAMSQGVPVGVLHCGVGLDDNLHTVVSVGISSEVTVSDDSLDDVWSAVVSVGITVGAGTLSLIGTSTPMLRELWRSWGRGLSRLHCANVTL